MFQINGLYTNLVNGVQKFLKANPAGGRPNGTEITDDWLNDVQSELLSVPAAAGLEAATGPGQLQLVPALNVMFAKVTTPMPHYAAYQSGSINAAASTTYAIASVPITFPAYSRTGAFRIRGRMLSHGTCTATGNYRQNFQSLLSDGTNLITGAFWLQGAIDASDSWGFSDPIESVATYAPGATVTFSMRIGTAGGDNIFTISGSYFELFVEEA